MNLHQRTSKLLGITVSTH